MQHELLTPAKKVRLVLLPALLTAMSVGAFAQDSASPRVETVVVTGSTKAPGCSLQLLNTVPMQVSNDIMTVQAGVNGKTTSFQFGTAAIGNQMTDAAARAAGLTPGNMGASRALTGSVGAALNNFTVPTVVGSPNQPIGIDGAANLGDSAAAEVYDSKGKAYANIVTVAGLSMQSMLFKTVDFNVTPFPPPGVDGVLNLSLFRGFDIDLNFAARSLNFFSQDHCKGQVLYWRAPGVAALPFVAKDNRIVAKVMLEGKELTAVIDTGSPISAVRFDAAERVFGISPDAAGLTLVGEHHANSRQDLYSYNFKILSFGKVAIVNPHLMLTQGILVRGANPTANTGSRVINDAVQAQPDMVIGLDLLKLMHLYIALHEQVLYVTQGPELAEGAANAQPVVPVTPFRP